MQLNVAQSWAEMLNTMFLFVILMFYFKCIALKDPKLYFTLFAVVC